MKQFYQMTLVIVLTITANFALANFQMENDSVSMGAGYANDIYYSLENGQISSVERTNWDIGFYTSPWSAGIITNGANGIDLYTVTDTSGWNSIDTSGMASWTALYNSADEWEDGAFNRNALGHPDYGWGVYNTITHNVVGDSIYLVKYSDGSIKKLWIEEKVSMANTFYFKYADLDGNNEVEEVLEVNDYTDKNFVYYSMKTEEVLNREPDKDSWDILFTKYMGINNDVPYPVTGVLNNVDVPANSFYPVAPDYDKWTAAPMDSTKSPVGYDWKSFDFATGWMVNDSTVFFVIDLNGNVNKLIFTGFEGMSSGKIYFEKSLTSPASVSVINNDAQFMLYPNPASDFIQIDLSGDIKWESLTISDLSGKVIFSQESGLNGIISLSTDNLNSGVYLVTTKSVQNIAIQKLIIQ